MKFFKQHHENKIINKNDLRTSLKSCVIILLSILFVACSSDDDSSSSAEDTEDLLTASKWYQESRTIGNFSDCEKNSSFKFNTDNTLNVESFNDDSGSCESQGILNATYVLSGTSLTITIGTEVITATINSISESSLNVTDSEGDTVIFDKTQG